MGQRDIQTVANVYSHVIVDKEIDRKPHLARVARGTKRAVSKKIPR